MKYIFFSKSLFNLYSYKRFLTEREKKLRLRRKHAEEIIAWKKKLDDEERQVREIEKQGIYIRLFLFFFLKIIIFFNYI